MPHDKRSQWYRFIYSPLGIAIGCIALFVLVKAAWNLHEKAAAADVRLSQAQSELVELEQQKADLSGSIRYLSTPEGVEATLREKYHAVKQGESVAVIIDGSQGNRQLAAAAYASTTSIASATTTAPSLSWWGRMWKGIGL